MFEHGVREMENHRNTEVIIISEFLSFRRMICPDLLQFIFWPVIVVGIYSNAWLMAVADYRIEWWSFASGILILRIAFECLFLYTYLKRTGQ